MFKTKEIINIALISSLALVLSLLVIFTMPNGGSITIYLVPLLLAATNSNLKTNFFIAIVTATLQIMAGAVVINPIQLLFDYYLPITFICCSQLIGLNKYVNIIIASFFAMISYVVSGMIFFEVNLIASITYNATFFIPTIIINILIYQLLNPRLKNIFEA